MFLKHTKLIFSVQMKPYKNKVRFCANPGNSTVIKACLDFSESTTKSLTRCNIINTYSASLYTIYPCQLLYSPWQQTWIQLEVLPCGSALIRENQILWVFLWLCNHEIIRSGPLKRTSVRADPAFWRFVGSQRNQLMCYYDNIQAIGVVSVKGLVRKSWAFCLVMVSEMSIVLWKYKSLLFMWVVK